MNLYYGSKINRSLVFRSQPRKVFNSSRPDYVRIFITEIIYWMWMRLFWFDGLPRMWMAGYNSASAQIGFSLHQHTLLLCCEYIHLTFSLHAGLWQWESFHVKRGVWGGGGGLKRSNVGMNDITECLGVPVLLSHDYFYQIGENFGYYVLFVGASYDSKG